MLQVDRIESIRDNLAGGKSYSEIAKELSLDYKTVKKYSEMDDFNMGAPGQTREYGSKLDPYTVWSPTIGQTETEGYYRINLVKEG